MTTVKFTTDIVVMLTEGLFSNEALVKEEYAAHTTLLFQILASKLEDSDSANKLVIDFLLKKFQKTKSSASINERQNIIKHMRACLESVKDGLVSQEMVEQILSVLLEHLY